MAVRRAAASKMDALQFITAKIGMPFKVFVITLASFTATQAILSTPFLRSASALLAKLGRCLTEQVEVNAPGTANRATFLPLKS